MKNSKIEIEIFKKASLCRHFENQVYLNIKNGLIKFPVYLSAGQEYAPSSIASLVQKKEIKPMIFGQHRGHSIYLSFGGDIIKLIKELKGHKDGCTYGMGGSLSIHSEKIKMYGHDGFMGSNAAIGVGACFSSKKPTIIFIGDAALEEDYVLATLSWVAKKKLPILFVVDDNDYAVLTKKDERRDWTAKKVAEAFKIKSFDVKDDPITIHNSLSRDIFKEPILINIHTNRMYWHAGAGKDSQKNKSFDRHGQQLNKLGSIALDYDNKIRKKIQKLWENY